MTTATRATSRSCVDCGETFEVQFDRQRYCENCWSLSHGTGPAGKPDLALVNNWTAERLGGPTWRASRAPDRACSLCEGSGWVTVEQGSVDSVARCRCCR